MKKYFAKFLCLLFLALTMQVSTAGAVTNNAKQNDVTISKTGENIEDFDQLRGELGKIEKNLEKENISREKIDEYVSFLSRQEATIIENRKEQEKQIKFIQKQLDALGEGPKDGETEDPVITKQREELTQKLAAQDRIVKETDLLSVQMEDMTVQVLNMRNQKIYGDMMTKQSAFINPLVFFSGVKAYMIFFWDVTKSPIEWYNNLPQNQKSYALFSVFVMFFILMVALIMAVLLKKFILRNWGYRADIEKPTFNRRVIAAIAVATARGLIFAFLVGGCILWMVSTKIFADSLLDTILMSTAFVTLLAIAEATISRVTFAPNYPQWRLVNIASEKAARFTRMIFTFIVINAIATIQVIVAQTAQYSTETVHFVMIVDCAVKALFLMWFSKVAFDTYKSEIKEDKETIADDEEASIDRGFKMIILSHLLCGATFALSFLGYPELSLFIFNHVIVSLLICGAFEILRRSLVDILRKIIVSGPWMKTYRHNKRLILKIEFWLKVFIYPAIALLLVFALLNFWGLPGDFMISVAKKLLFGFKIGGIQLSLLAVILGIVVFFGSLALVRLLKRNLAENVLATIDMDDGIKHSLISGVGFIGFIISTLLAIIAVGIDLTNLAFIAGALSVGIGFGLQDVIKNLVAGIIILLERPFRVGDWVVLSGVEGTIKQINIRSTELQSFNRTSVIIPNATLISSSVTNMTHGDNISRQSIAVGVAYGSDVKKVRDILLECAIKSKLVMKNPAPYVLFKDFGSSSLDFELRFYVNDIWKGWTSPSELRYEIYRRFDEEGIEIPFPQVVVNRPSSEKQHEPDDKHDETNEDSAAEN